MKPNTVVHLNVRHQQEDERLNRDQRAELRQRIQSDVGAYLANGGTVEVVPGIETTISQRRVIPCGWGSTGNVTRGGEV